MAVPSKPAPDRELRVIEIHELIAEIASAVSVENKRVLIIIPDGARRMPTSLL